MTVVFGSRRKRLEDELSECLEEMGNDGTYGEVLCTGTLSASPRVEIPLTRNVFAGERAFYWEMTGIDGMLIIRR